MKYKKPNITPSLIDCESNFFNLLNTKGKNMIAAVENRKERNIMGDIEPKAVLMIAKVPPQITVVNKSADSPLYFLIINY
jgi:hypothetical protein